MGTNKRYYRARATRGQLGQTAAEKPQIVVDFAILTENATHQHLAWYGYFTENTQERTIESLRTAGFKGDDLMEFENGLDFPADAPEVELVVEDEEYNGKVSAKVQWVNKAGGLAVKAPLQGDKARAFAASMKSAFRAHDAAKGERKAAPASPPKAAPKPAQDTRPEPPPLGDADIPF